MTLPLLQSILAIDPGPVTSGVMLLQESIQCICSDTGEMFEIPPEILQHHGQMKNQDVLDVLEDYASQNRLIFVQPGNNKITTLESNDAAIFHSNDKNASLGSNNRLVAIEMIASYGMAVGRETFETCVWIGRFHQHYLNCVPSEIQPLVRYCYRKDIKMHLCHTMRAKDANVRQALLDRYTVGGNHPVGKKANPGPLYGVSTHSWSALAVGIYAYDRRKEFLEAK